MLQDVSGRGTWSKKCFKMSLAEALGARNAARCLWQRLLGQEMLQDVSGRGTWSKTCFMMSLAGALGARNTKGGWSKKCFKIYLAEARTWSKICFKMSLVEALGTRHALRCLWQRHLEQDMLQDMLQDVSDRGTWSKAFWGSIPPLSGQRDASGSGGCAGDEQADDVLVGDPTVQQCLTGLRGQVSE